MLATLATHVASLSSDKTVMLQCGVTGGGGPYDAADNNDIESTHCI
jgi:hypothetical protein